MGMGERVDAWFVVCHQRSRSALLRARLYRASLERPILPVGIRPLACRCASNICMLSVTTPRVPAFRFNATSTIFGSSGFTAYDAD
jgi:hypothetical protein